LRYQLIHQLPPHLTSQDSLRLVEDPTLTLYTVVY
jgi:hypothetical protein